MKATVIVMTFALIIAGVTLVPLSGVAQSAGQHIPGAPAIQDADENETDEPPPGARLAGVVGAHEAEVRGEVDTRAFDAALARAESDEAKARIVASQVGELDKRLDDLQEQKRDLQRAHRSGNISTATYVAELTELTARTESARGLANQSDAAARDLPPDVAASQGVNVTAIRTLEQRAANLTGPEVSRIARSIAGPDVGKPVSAGPPDNKSTGPPDRDSIGSSDDRGNGAPADRSDRGASGKNTSTGAGNGVGETETVPDGAENATDGARNASQGVGNATEDVGNTTEGEGNTGDDGDDPSEGNGTAPGGDENASTRAATTIDRASTRIAGAAAVINDSEVATNVSAIADAEDAIDAARDDLEAARSALEDGDTETARRLAEQAIERAEHAEALVAEAAGDATDSP